MVSLLKSPKAVSRPFGVELPDHPNSLGFPNVAKYEMPICTRVPMYICD